MRALLMEIHNSYMSTAISPSPKVKQALFAEGNMIVFVNGVSSLKQCGCEHMICLGWFGEHDWILLTVVQLFGVGPPRALPELFQAGLGQGSGLGCMVEFERVCLSYCHPGPQHVWEGGSEPQVLTPLLQDG